MATGTNNPAIRSFVLFDLESTGLQSPGYEPKITELSFVAVTRDELLTKGAKPRVLNKLTLCFNPEKRIPPKVAGMTGLHNDALELMNNFKTQSSLVISFLRRLPRPVCIIAHYGNGFDFPLMISELQRADKDIPEHILCADSLEAFRTLDGLSPLSEFLKGKSQQRKRAQQFKISKTPEDEKETWNASVVSVRSPRKSASTKNDPVSPVTQFGQRLSLEEQSGSPARRYVPSGKGVEDVRYFDEHTSVSRRAVRQQEPQIQERQLKTSRHTEGEGLRRFQSSYVIPDERRYDQMYETRTSSTQVRTTRQVVAPKTATDRPETASAVLPRRGSSELGDHKGSYYRRPGTPVERRDLPEARDDSDEEDADEDTDEDTDVDTGASDKSRDGSGEKKESSKEVSYKLSAVYSRMFGQEPDVSHTAEDDCLTMLKIVHVLSRKFIEWCDANAVPLNSVDPMY
ncbi:uncharacterized protein LOC101851949 [Aplysia californica]|uniref:Uncharacterized protein LOC101851949 n=1 Tax=Aplysia californica TaxID=6500 RepID=A0ABM1A0C8_APLCA|nr:uncharacterized protein LOC101851949 [Aplysia californica]